MGQVVLFKAIIFVMMVDYLLASEFTLSEKCSKCRTISQQFREGLLRTAKSNFGGGNTDWEEKKLKGYAASETRLIEILESVCPSDKFCSLFLESQEETIENWWFDNGDLLRSSSTTDDGAAKIADQFTDFLCIHETSVCCPNNTYGPTCQLCPSKISTKACSGSGSCNGDGTRSGTGKCHCSQGYVGDECASCDSGFYPSTGDEQRLIHCLTCEANCGDCASGGPGQCAKCKAGFLLNQAGESALGSCTDIDECLEAEENPCKTPSTYCANIPGSYKCVSCDSSCDSAGCTGPGPGACTGDCKTGYRKVDDRCEDVDECAESETEGTKLCGEAKVDENISPVCINTPGSFRCGCSSVDYDFADGVCSRIKPMEDEVDGETIEEAKKKYTDKKKVKKPKKKAPKPVSNKSPSQSKVAALETDFSLIYFCAMLVVSIVVISYLANKPHPWPAVAAVLLVATAVYVYYYVGMHDPKNAASGGSASKGAQKSGKTSRKS